MEEEKQLIKDLWKLWEDLSEVGELTIGIGFHERFKVLENKVNKTLSQDDGGITEISK